jgi:DNA-binding GntR family transcriptional regulator
MSIIPVPQPLVDQAVDLLRQDLLSGVHEPGTKLKVEMVMLPPKAETAGLQP